MRTALAALLAMALSSPLAQAKSPHSGPVVAGNPEDARWDDRFHLQGFGGAGAMVVDGSGTLYGVVGTPVTADAVYNVVRWEGSDWSPMGSANGGVVVLASAGPGSIYSAGDFNILDGMSIDRIARWDGTSWSSLGSGVNAYVRALVVDGNGNLYAGGDFTSAGGVAANRVARWDGTSWSPLGAGVNGTVQCLALDGNGNLYAGGSFTTAGGLSANRIARWDGTTWTAMGSGMSIPGDPFTTPVVYALAVAGGSVYAGGIFTAAGGLGAPYIARWNGTSWSSVGSGMTNPDLFPTPMVNALAVDAGGDVYAGGFFPVAGGVIANSIARWNGSSWSAVGSGITAPISFPSVQRLLFSGSGVLYISGYFSSVDGVDAMNAASRDGTTWSAMGPPGEGVRTWTHSAAADGGNVFVGGGFYRAGDALAQNIARWDGTSWSPLGSGLNSTCVALAADGAGNLYAGGSFTIAGGVNANRIARWDGTSWSALGSGTASSVGSVAVDGSGVYAGGSFTTAGGVSANRIARWDGSSWSALGSGIDGSGTPHVRAIAMDGNGGLYAGGVFTLAGGLSASNVAHWNGASWSALGAGVNDRVNALLVDGGNLYAAGEFTTAGGVSATKIARWDGTSWSALGAGLGTAGSLVNELAMDGSGNLYAGGGFITAGGAKHIARWDGSSWSALGSGVNSTVNALVVDGNGDVYVGGVFNVAGNKQSAYFAVWHADDNVAVPPTPGRPSIASFGSPSPNPFRAATRIAYELPAAGHVRAAVFDLNGRRVRTLMDEGAPAGAHSLAWDGRDARGALLPSGVYLIQASVGQGVAMRRVALIR